MALVETSTDGAGVQTVTLADEERRNVLSADLLGELVPILDDAESDDAVRVIVLTNAGSVFCAGADLSGGSNRSSRGSGGPSALDLFARFSRSPKPYVGRLAGHCVAGGMGIAAGMDLCYAVDTAKMGFTEVRIGVAPAMISVLCLPKMRRADAAAAFLRGNRFLAPEAQRLGIITAAVPEDELDAEVDAAVQDLLLAGPGALAATKQLLARIPEMTAEDAFEWTKQLSGELFGSDEAREGMAAFMEKRPPPWAP